MRTRKFVAAKPRESKWAHSEPTTANWGEHKTQSQDLPEERLPSHSISGAACSADRPALLPGHGAYGGKVEFDLRPVSDAAGLGNAPRYPMLRSKRRASRKLWVGVDSVTKATY